MTPDVGLCARKLVGGRASGVGQVIRSAGSDLRRSELLSPTPEIMGSRATIWYSSES